MLKLFHSEAKQLSWENRNNLCASSCSRVEELLELAMKFFAQTTRRCAALLACAILALAVGCEKKSAPNVLARIGEQVITVDDFKAEVQRRTANRQSIPERKVLLEEMIARATLVQRAKAAGLESAADVRRTYEDVLITKLKESEFEPGLAAVKISPEEIRAAYEKEILHFTQPAKAHLAMVFLAADSKAGTNRLAEVAARANQAHRLALELPPSEPSFGKVSADFSEDQVSRYRGGDAGWFTVDNLAGRWPKEIIATGLALKNVGDVSEVIHAGNGFYFVKKMDVRPTVVTPLAQAQAGIERRLLAAKRAQLEVEFRQSSLAGRKVERDLQLLSQLDFPNHTIVSAQNIPPSLPASP
jgi:peptidyl-prolyl cis-trans isomerase C